MNSSVHSVVLLLLLTCILSLQSIHLVNGLYVPGVDRADYHNGSRIDLLANSPFSEVTQIRYQYTDFPVCSPESDYLPMNLGEALHGDRIFNLLPYHVVAVQSVSCALACEMTLTQERAQLWQTRIQQDYQYLFSLDNMPAVSDQFREGTHMGVKAENSADVFLYNHLIIKPQYHVVPSDDSAYDPNVEKIRVVGLKIEPKSYAGDACDGEMYKIDTEAEKSVRYTYDVVWEESPVDWRERWDSLLTMPAEMTDGHVKTFIISLVLDALLMLMVLFTLFKTVRDIRRYNADHDLRQAQEEEADDDENGQMLLREFDETGWKNCHTDVFRNPSRPGVLSVLVGVGIQLSIAASFVVLLGAFGIVNPARRGSLETSFVLVWAFTGLISGFVSSRLFRMFREQTPIKIAAVSSLGFPVPTMVLGLIVNFVLLGVHAAQAIPFVFMLAVFALWIVFVIGNFVGRWLAGRHRTYKYPVQPGKGLRNPNVLAPWYVKPWPTVFISGILPFAVMFISIRYIEDAVWAYQRYYLYGFMILTVLLVAVTAAATSIIVTYFFLCWENCYWWWRAFVAPGSAAIYVFIYLFSFMFELEISSGAGVFLYFIHAVGISGALFVMLGSIGFLSSLLYVWKMYSSVKID